MTKLTHRDSCPKCGAQAEIRQSGEMPYASVGERPSPAEHGLDELARGIAEDLGSDPERTRQWVYVVNRYGFVPEG